MLKNKTIWKVVNIATVFLKTSTWDTNPRSNKFCKSSSQLRTNHQSQFPKPLKFTTKSSLTIIFSPRKTFLTVLKPSSISSKVQSWKNFNHSSVRSTCPTNYNLESKKWWWKSRWETTKSLIVYCRLAQTSLRTSETPETTVILKERLYRCN